ncbi:replication initiator [Streptomyces sp. NPDC086777]|uniref:replication initiator n=1 Tax=Streptomyces sp. NPDC086777 TaxID=3154866 RepID=UPI003450B2F5
MRRPLDLRHVISPGLRDLIELANTHDFDRVQQQVRDLRGCTSPVNLHGFTITTDQTAKEVVRSYRSEDEPSGRLLTTCGNRRSSRCPACSRVYAADTYHLIKAGLSGGRNVAETVRDHPRAFVTLTAPSSGPVHNRPTTGAGKPRPFARPCACGDTHAEDAPELGTPLNPATYDYTGAVLWNAHAGQLWARFTTYLRRVLAKHFGMTQKALNQSLRVSFAKVAEYQKRGLVHFQAVIRFDGPDGHTSPPPAWATFDALSAAVSPAVKSARLTIASDAIGERVIAWGGRYKVDPITALGERRTHRRARCRVNRRQGHRARRQVRHQERRRHRHRGPHPDVVPVPNAATYAALTASTTCAPTATAPDRPNPSRPCPYSSMYGR